MSSNCVEQENFLNNENGTSGIGVAKESKRGFMDRFFYSKNQSKTAQQQQQQQEEMVDFKVEPLSGTAINSSSSSENKLEPRMKWDSISEYVLSIIGFVIDLGNVCCLDF